MKKTTSILLLASASFVAAPAHAAAGVELRGSPASMVQQHEVARAEGYTFIGAPSQVETMVDKKYLVRIEGNEDYKVSPGVSYPFARPAVAVFLERLSAQYREACGERLVVTSLTRPTSQQPANAHKLSVHPAGMAVDLRISERAACREWLENTLLSLEDKKLLDATRERTPPHYHIAIFPEAYTAYVKNLEAAETERVAAAAAAKAADAKRASQTASVQPTAAKTEKSRSSEKGALAVSLLLAGALFGHARRRGN